MTQAKMTPRICFSVAFVPMGSTGITSRSDAHGFDMFEDPAVRDMLLLDLLCLAIARQAAERHAASARKGKTRRSA